MDGGDGGSVLLEHGERGKVAAVRSCRRTYQETKPRRGTIVVLRVGAVDRK